MNQPLLTIGIPTYNGGHYLESTIQSIVSQFNSISTDDIEILIIDNASTDNTEEIATRFINTYPHQIRYFKNEENIGYDRNVDKTIKSARGTFVEFLGDDDFYCTERSLSELLITIKNNRDISVLHFGYKYFDIGTNSIINGTEFKIDMKFTSQDDFFCATLFQCSTLSSLIIKRVDWVNLDLSKYHGTSWIQVGALINILSKKTTSFISAHPKTIVRIANDRWTQNFGNIVDLKLKLLHIFREMNDLGYRKETYYKFRNYYFRDNIHLILAARSKNFKGRYKTVKEMAKFYYMKPRFWIIDIPVLFAPINLSNLISLSIRFKKKFF